MWLGYGTRYRSGWRSGVRRHIYVLVVARGYNSRAERVYIDCPITIFDRVTYFDLIDLAMLDFGIILGMDWLHKCYVTIDYQNRV